MLAGLSSFDLMPYLEAFPSLKYIFAVGAMFLTWRGIAGSWRKLLNADAPAPTLPAPAYDSAAARLERKVDLLTFHMREARADLHDLLQVVQPGERRRPRRAPPDSSDHTEGG